MQVYGRLLGSWFASSARFSSGRSVRLLVKVVNHDIFERFEGWHAKTSHDALPVTATAFGTSASTPAREKKEKREKTEKPEKTEKVVQSRVENNRSKKSGLSKKGVS